MIAILLWILGGVLGLALAGFFALALALGSTSEKVRKKLKSD